MSGAAGRTARAVAAERPIAVIRAARDRPCTLLVCRGCCCGNPRKHPGTDHAGQLERLSTAAADSVGRFTIRTTDCLGPCDQANVVVLQPSTEGRRHGGWAVWIGFAMDDGLTDDLLRWIDQGGPGLAAPPAALELQFIRAPGVDGTRARGRRRARG
ncbi:(2Fe-2S) ferredoxin domain-containing protein [Streptomyces sp. NPDC050516]|uniref:(2Fe-2S) ferredoxin domain-containing protein n=1 Tax=Streptomyces sp. NPDC050516 TaxID=3365621 RepID=UPI0037997548